MAIQRLVALDFEGNHDPAPVLAFIGDALIEHVVDEEPHWRTGQPLPRHCFTFDAGMVRNTEVHAAGFRAGFVVHLDFLEFPPSEE